MVLAGSLLAGRYQLDEPIGTGWFSQVWRATDSALSRPVAVKLLHPAYAHQPEALARFRVEARHAATLWHENIVHIYDYDEPAEGPQPYLVMELVDGPSLTRELAGGPLDAARTMGIVAQAAAGLQAAHATGLVHGGIKPGNLLLASSGSVRITDWGISHAIGSVPVAVTETATGAVEYLAPERIAGAQAAPASDLYALGVVAYECLAGAPPFVGEPPDVACAHRDHAVPPLAGSVPADVSALVMRLVAKDPVARPGSAAEVAQQAGRLRDDFSVGAGLTPYLPAAAAVVPPPRPAMEAAAVADDVGWQVPPPTPPAPASGAHSGARRLRRRPVLVLASVVIAGLIGMVLAVTVGATSVRELAAAPPAARPAHSASGSVAGPPAHRPSSARPTRSARPGDTGTVPVVVSNHRTSTSPVSGHKGIRTHRDGRYPGHGRRHGHGYWHGHGHGNGNGDSHGHGNGNGDSHGHGNGNGDSHGHGNEYGQGNGNENAQVLSISSYRPSATRHLGE